MRKYLFTVLLAAAFLGACALPKVELMPLEATLGQPLAVTIYHVPT